MCSARRSVTRLQTFIRFMDSVGLLGNAILTGAILGNTLENVKGPEVSIKYGTGATNASQTLTHKPILIYSMLTGVFIPCGGDTAIYTTGNYVLYATWDGNVTITYNAAPVSGGSSSGWASVYAFLLLIG